MYRKTYVQINIDNIKNNVKQLIDHYNNYDYYIGVVKGNAYGHGVYIINDLIEAGINYLAVSSLEEAIEVRNINKFIPILCLEPISLEYIDLCISNNITIIIHDYKYYKDLLNRKIDKKLRIHLKIDTGMNRLGLNDKHQIKEIFDNIAVNPNLVIEGIFSHFSTFGISDKIWDNQVARFKELTSLIDLTQIKIVHLGKSMTLVNHPKIPFCNGIRLGIIMYGYDQTPRYGSDIKSQLRKIKANMRIKKEEISETTIELPVKLKEAYQVHSEIIQIKDVKKGEFVGYGTCYQASEDIKVAVIAIGYADGYSRRNYNGHVLINNKKYPIIGDICMGMIIAKIDNTVDINDDVVIIGDELSVREVSHHINTSVYETLCMFDKKIPKVYIKDNKVVKIEE